MKYRTLAPTLQKISDAFSVLVLTGPRQVGKTTLLKACAASDRGYVTLDDLEQRALAQTDPVLFLQNYPAPVLSGQLVMAYQTRYFKCFQAAKAPFTQQ